MPLMMIRFLLRIAFSSAAFLPAGAEDLRTWKQAGSGARLPRTSPVPVLFLNRESGYFEMRLTMTVDSKVSFTLHFSTPCPSMPSAS